MNHRLALMTTISLVVSISVWVAGCSNDSDDKKNADKPQTMDKGADVPSPSSAQPQRVRPTPEELKNAARPVLDEAKKHPMSQVREAWIRALDDLHDTDAIGDLGDLVRREMDPGVRASAWNVLGQFGADRYADLLDEQWREAEGGELVTLTQAKYRLGSKKTRRRMRSHLNKLARSSDIDIAYPAANALAELSSPGDRRAMDALRRLVSRQAELQDVAPITAPIAIQARQAQLGDRDARQHLYKLLEHADEAVRLTAADSLARIGDSTGHDALIAIVNDGQSPNRAFAAAVLVSLGDYDGIELLLDGLRAPDANTRDIAARALGVMGEPMYLEALSDLYDDPDHAVRIRGATSVLLVLGFQPRVLVRESVDWARQALSSEDWSTRAAVARVISDLPEDKAIPLFRQVSVDPEPRVRLQAARSAARMKTPEVFDTLALAMNVERDVDVKEAQIYALAKSPEATEQIKAALHLEVSDKARVGILAMGSLVALGDMDLASRLDTVYRKARTKLRLAVMHSLMLADNPLVVPTLEAGIKDVAFTVRFAAANGLAHYLSRKDVALPVLREGLEQSVELRGQALRGLAQFGEQARVAEAVEEILESDDPRAHEAVLDVIPELDFQRAQPLIILALKSPMPEVAVSALDTVDGYTKEHPREVSHIMKMHVRSDNPVVRAKSKAKLAPLMQTVWPKAPEQSRSVHVDAQPVDTAALRAGVDATRAALTPLDTFSKKLAIVLKEAHERMAKEPRGERDIDNAQKLLPRIEAAQKQIIDAHGRVGEQANKTREIAAALPQEDQAVAEQVATLTQLEARASKLARESGAQVADTLRALETWLGKYGNLPCLLYIAEAETAVAAGSMGNARRNLRRARKHAKQSPTCRPRMLFAEAYYHHELARETAQKAKKQSYLEHAKASYEAFLATSPGELVEDVNARIREIDTELATLNGNAS